ncbi:MAG: hypothetical protein FJX74_07010 [Armatimonadetes bacterium]|nr:hypothetical protein [Armatimonadota bacterium]
MLLSPCRRCGADTSRQGEVRVGRSAACPTCGLAYVYCSECLAPHRADVTPDRFECGHRETARALDTAPRFEGEWACSGHTGSVTASPDWDRPDGLVDQLNFNEDISRPALRYGRVFAIGRSGALRALDLATGSPPLGWHRESDDRLPVTRDTPAERLTLRAAGAVLYVQIADGLHLHSIVDGTERAVVTTGRYTASVVGDRWLVTLTDDPGGHVARAYALGSLLAEGAAQPMEEWYLTGAEGSPEPPTAARTDRHEPTLPRLPLIDAADRVLLATPHEVYLWKPGSKKPPRSWLSIPPNQELRHMALGEAGQFALLQDDASKRFSFTREVPDGDPPHAECPLEFAPEPPIFSVVDGRLVFCGTDGKLHMLDVKSLHPWGTPVYVGEPKAGGQRMVSFAASLSPKGFRVVWLWKQQHNVMHVQHVAVDGSTGAHGGSAQVPNLSVSPDFRPAMLVGEDFVIGFNLKGGIGYVRNLE